MIKIPSMLMVGSADRNCGKTEFACSVINKFSSQRDIIGIKVTVIEKAKSRCPRGGEGCGACASLEGCYDIFEETNSASEKDTSRMLAAGAKKVFWLRILKPHIEKGVSALMKIIGGDAILVCESNSLRLLVEPGLFVMLKSSDTKNCKASAKQVSEYTDKTVISDGKSFNINTDEFSLIDDRWALKLDATAIIIAGGKSVRMGTDKAMLDIDGEPMIKHIVEKLRPFFKQILISSDDTSKYSFLNVEVIPDRISDKGPAMGIASTLAISANETNFVIACDIPQIDISLVQQLLRNSNGFDAVMPKAGRSKFEPLFAVYKKSIAKTIDKQIDLGVRRVIDCIKDCKVKYIDVTGGEIKNLNATTDYKRFHS